MTIVRVLFLISLFFTSIIHSQPTKIMNAAGIKSAMEKLNVLGSVLYVAAHPDDENTAALAYFSYGKKYRTAYLSMTRGDGGQNLIGAEKGDLMGVIRTNELLEARKIDGVEQYFTRAIDFGYSKSPEETIEFWGRENVLYDIVWVIRKFRPDVIVTRFPPGGWNTHGHHLASAMLAVDAFSLAADSTKFSDQLDKVEPWQAKRIVWDSWLPYMNNFDGDESEYVTADIGSYNKLLGKSFTEIAAESRSKHKSQGFGAQARRGSRTAYFKHLAGDTATSDLFEGVETTWAKFPFGLPLIHVVDNISESFNVSDPAESLDDLLNLREYLSDYDNNYWVEQKLSEIDKIIQSYTGLWMEAIADDYTVAQGDSIVINLSIVKRDSTDVILKEIKVNSNYKELIDTVIDYNRDYIFERKVYFEDDYPLTQPHWLNMEKSGWNFQSQDDLTLAEINPLKAYFTIEIKGQVITFETPILYRWVDRVKGEKYRRLAVMPHVTQNFDKDIYLSSGEDTTEIKLLLKSYTDDLNGEVKLITDSGWDVIPAETEISLEDKYDEDEVSFRINRNNDASVCEIKAVASVGNVYSTSVYELNYDHIPYQYVLSPAESKVVSVNSKKTIDNIGYIMGAGDDIPKVLETLGYNVDLLDLEKINDTDLNNYDAIITGIRAYNTEEELKFINPKLIAYVKQGGRLVVQYNVSFGLVTEEIGPYPFKISRNRVTDELAEVTFINPEHELLNYPNKINNSDFTGWVQERGLYFADNWDDNYDTLIKWNDDGEEPKEGALIYTEYGEGEFIYTGISFFRQLPAGVPGAVRLFVNLISGKD